MNILKAIKTMQDQGIPDEIIAQFNVPDKYDISTRTLRYYEDMGLITRLYNRKNKKG